MTMLLDPDAVLFVRAVPNIPGLRALVNMPARDRRVSSVRAAVAAARLAAVDAHG